MNEPAAGYAAWEGAAGKLLRTARLEASRAGASEVSPAHLLLALIDQPEMHQALRAMRRAPDVYAMRARVAAASLGPVEFSEETPLSRLTESILDDVRGPGPDEPTQFLFLLAFKRALEVETCRTLLRAGGADLALLDLAFARVE